MAIKISVVDILEAKYIQCIEIYGKEPVKIYMNEDMLFLLYKEVISQIAGIRLVWEEVKKDGMKYRGINISITESLSLYEVIVL